MPCPPERHYTEWYAVEYAIQMGEMERTCSGLNRIPIMAELPYYDSLLIQHLGDPMHQEGNVVKNLLQHLFGQVDKPKHRKACEEFGVHRSAWIQVRPNRTEVIRPAAWVLTRDERSVFRQRVQDIRTPTWYGSNFRAAFAHNDSNIWGKGLKTHDYHRLIQDIIPIIMLDLGDDILRRAICSLSRLLRWVCAKELTPGETEEMQVLAAETLCLMEECLPPSFFKGQTHWLLHLPREVSLCGPVHTRWMYFIERYLRVLKDYIRQHARMEGCIAEGHLLSEIMFFGSEVLGRLDSSAPVSSFVEEPDVREMDEYAYGGKQKKKLDRVQYLQAHTFILHNSEIMQPWVAKFDEVRSNTRANRRPSSVTFLEFMCVSIQKIDDGEQLLEFPELTNDVRNIVIGPFHQVKTYTQLWSLGRHFRIKGLDDKLSRTQDCGLAPLALQRLMVEERHERFAKPNSGFWDSDDKV
ncbi:hypothetical protein R1sor_027474 [Riccia sorocarpa]|uniref:DUF4218 domain-containing protein n=1 Tax=Riccia sorocarpa TaxID=122646 RepID=A0ABD3GFS6_9MARC